MQPNLSIYIITLFTHTLSKYFTKLFVCRSGADSQWRSTAPSLQPDGAGGDPAITHISLPLHHILLPQHLLLPLLLSPRYIHVYTCSQGLIIWGQYTKDVGWPTCIYVLKPIRLHLAPGKMIQYVITAHTVGTSEVCPSEVWTYFTYV